MTLQDIAPDSRVLVSLDHERLSVATAARNGSAADISWHDWNIAKDILSDGQSILFEDAVKPQGRTIHLPFAKSTAHRPCNWVKEVQVDSRRTANG